MYLLFPTNVLHFVEKPFLQKDKTKPLSVTFAFLNLTQQKDLQVTDFLKDLNEEQYKAVTAPNGAAMVIAGAGSGKTRVLTYRIAYILSQGVDPFNILALTFTNKAAREMKERVMSLIGDGDARNVWMGTFHSIFARILRFDGSHLGYPSNFTIYDSDDSKRLIRQIISEKNLDNKTYNPSYIQARISMAKSSLILPENYGANAEIQAADAAARKPLISEIYATYNNRLRRADAMDFDDLLLNTFRLFNEFEEVLYKWQRRFQHVLVDEYQDTNHVQYMIIKKLASNNENIYVVGDDAQSIYSFRGANIQNMLNFKSDYPDYNLFKLQQNYRSTKTIVEAANKIIANNREQIKKTVWTNNEEGQKIGLVRATSDTEEGNMVAGSVFEIKMREQQPNKSFAVLYRTNAQSRSIEEALRKRNIPYRIYGGLSFYQRKEIKDLLAYFRLVINNHDEDALQRAINNPSRGIGKTSMERIMIATDQHNTNMWEVINNPVSHGVSVNSGTARKLVAFATMIKSFEVVVKNKDAFDAAQHIAVASGLLKMYKDDDAIESMSRVENIEELLNSIKEFSEKGAEQAEGDLENQGTFVEFMQNIALLTDADNEDKEDNDKVTLMTIHAAKGLEFPYVFLVGLEENLFPSMQSVSTRTDLEEERRLFYVAVTRAMKKLTISYAETRYRWGQLTMGEPSRFIEEVDDALLDIPQKAKIGRERDFRKSEKTIISSAPSFQKRNLKPVGNTATSFEASDTSDLQAGMQVEHPKFGTGKVVAVEGSGPNKKAAVFFPGVGQKKLLLRFAKLKVL
jgi:DNA helicase-2/ATP-dependent DNA helicase PcrA